MDDHREFGVNVKVYDWPRTVAERHLSDETLSEIATGCISDFWMAVDNGAQDQFGVEVAQEGRMGGWAVPMPIIDPIEQPTRFAAFREFIESERDYYLAQFPERVKAVAYDESNIVRGEN